MEQTTETTTYDLNQELYKLAEKLTLKYFSTVVNIQFLAPKMIKEYVDVIFEQLKQDIGADYNQIIRNSITYFYDKDIETFNYLKLSNPEDVKNIENIDFCTTEERFLDLLKPHNYYNCNIDTHKLDDYLNRALTDDGELSDSIVLFYYKLLESRKVVPSINISLPLDAITSETLREQVKVHLFNRIKYLKYSEPSDLDFSDIDMGL